VEQSEPDLLNQLCDVVENERRKLMRAEAVLGCLAVSLVPSDEDDEIPTFHSDVADVARRLVRDSAYRLNSLDVDSLPERIQDARGRTTKRKRVGKPGAL
jgi:hypothetical protein